MNNIISNNNEQRHGSDPQYYHQPYQYTSIELQKQQQHQQHQIQQQYYQQNNDYQYQSNHNQQSLNQQLPYQYYQMNNNSNIQNNQLSINPNNNENSQQLQNTQYYNQLSFSSLDQEIKNNEAQLQLLKQENEQLNQEIKDFNQNVFQQQGQQYPTQLISPMLLNQVALIDDQPELAYCSATLNQHKKYYSPNDLSTHGLVSLLQRIHNHMKLDYSAITIIEQANLFSDKFIEEEIVQKLEKTNKYLNKLTIAGSKPVYCCNHFHKLLNKYATGFCFTQLFWIITLISIYTICTLVSEGENIYNLIFYYFYICYLTIELSLIFFGMKSCSLTQFKIASIMSFIGFFIGFLITSVSMYSMGGFQIQKCLVIIFIANVINMFLQMFMIAIIQIMLQGMKRLLAVVVQISATDLIL